MQIDKRALDLYPIYNRSGINASKSVKGQFKHHKQNRIEQENIITTHRSRSEGSTRNDRNDRDEFIKHKSSTKI